MVAVPRVFCEACAGVTVAGLKNATTKAAKTEAESVICRGLTDGEILEGETADERDAATLRHSNKRLGIIAKDMNLLLPRDRPK